MGVTLTPTAPTPVVLTPTQPTPVVLVLGQGGPPGPAGTGDLSFVATISVASASWVIAVPAAMIAVGKVPSVTVYDTAGNNIVCGVVFNAIAETLTVSFSAPMAGVAYLN